MTHPFSYDGISHDSSMCTPELLSPTVTLCFCEIAFLYHSSKPPQPHYLQEPYRPVLSVLESELSHRAIPYHESLKGRHPTIGSVASETRDLDPISAINWLCDFGLIISFNCICFFTG